MIAIVEMNCREFEHETPNSGFVYGVCNAYPEETVLFCAHAEYIANIKMIFQKRKIVLNNIEYRAIGGKAGSTLLEFVPNFFVLLRLFSVFLRSNVRSVLFLSIWGGQNFIIKNFARLSCFSHMGFVFTLHGEMEKLLGADLSSCVSFPPKISKSLASKLTSYSFGELCSKFKTFLGDKLINIKRRMHAWFELNLENCAMLSYRHSDRFRYVVLSDHIIPCLEKVLDTSQYNFTAIPMPCIFPPPPAELNNSYAKFAVFGGGNPQVLQQIHAVLASKTLHKNYEIRIIGRNTLGLQGLDHVTCPASGILSRTEMETLASDIDMFLGLYEDFRYRACCSASIVESFIYCKPLVYLENKCFSSFDSDTAPIGIRCPDVEAFANALADIIENYDSFKTQLKFFRRNMISHRERIDVANNAERLRSILTF